MTRQEALLPAAEAARRIGVSPKALRLYEQHGMLRPRRSAAGWRFYGPDEMAVAHRIAAYRALGMSLAQVRTVLMGDAGVLDGLLASHLGRLDQQMEQAATRREAVRTLRRRLAEGIVPTADDLAGTLGPAAPAVALDLPWPWAGERFELPRLPPVTYLTGPLGSGKTRLARALAAHIEGAVFSELARQGNAGTKQRLDGDAALKGRMDAVLGWLVEDGANESDALTALLLAMLDPGARTVVVDLVEEGLDQATQSALGAWLERYDDTDRRLIVMTRSTAILDMERPSPGSVVIYCPANHSPPCCVVPVPGAAGYEAVVSCLAPPEVRQRTAGMIAIMPEKAG